MSDLFMGNTPERFLWAASLLNVKPGQHILEIGCGVGILAEQICNTLSNGCLTAIDKSAAMVDKAKKRNQAFIENQLASFTIANFKDVSLEQSYYDTIVAFNVNFFWKDARAELESIRRSLKQTGRLFVFYQSPFEIEISAAEPIKENLLLNSFKIIDVELKRLSPASAFCITAIPKHR